MDSSTAQEWLDRYVSAWTSQEREEIASLFSEGVSYRYHPYDEPIVGRDAVVASWLGEGDSPDASELDEPGTFGAAYAPVAVDGDVVVATGSSSYSETPGGPVVQVYFNCFVIRFDDDGRCCEFTEYFIERPRK